MPPVDIKILPLTGEYDATVVDSGSAPSNVIRTEDSWSVPMKWRIEGALAHSLGGRWRVQVAFESQGNQGVEKITTAPTIAYTSGAFGFNGSQPVADFSTTMNFAPGDPPLTGQPDVPYRLTAMLTYINSVGQPGPMAAAIDLGTVTFFDSTILAP